MTFEIEAARENQMIKMFIVDELNEISTKLTKRRNMRYRQCVYVWLDLDSKRSRKVYVK